MNIKDALIPTGKAVRIEHADNYAAIKSFSLASPIVLGGERLYWYNTKTDEENSPVQLDAILADDWQPYFDETIIRPENEGEIWKGLVSGMLYHTEIINNKLQFVTKKGVLEIMEDEYHGKYMERIHPSMED